MELNSVELGPINYRKLFPWIHLFRAFRIAVDIRKMFLAGLALLALAVGDRLFTGMRFAPESAVSTAWPWDADIGRAHHARGLAGGLRTDPSRTFIDVATNWTLVLQPLETVAKPVETLLRAGCTWPQAVLAWTRLFWAFAVWSLFGGAITRMAAVQFARDENIGLRAALRHSCGKFVSYMTAPLLPLAGISFFWVLCLVGGLFGRIPVIGEPVVGALFFMPLIFGFIMALIAILAAAGWPLMFAAISAEGSDAFDGFSRSYSYVYNRPWHYLWYAIVSMLYGSIVILFVSLMAGAIVYLTGWGLASGLGAEQTGLLFQAAPAAVGGPDLLTDVSVKDPSLGTILAGSWLNLLGMLVSGFVSSYFWTAATIIYFLLRLSDDATALDEVYILDEEDEEDDLLPLVGVADSDQPVIERPAGDPPAEDQPQQPETAEDESTG